MERTAGGRQRRHDGGFDDDDTDVVDSARSCCTFHDTIMAEEAAEVRYMAKKTKRSAGAVKKGGQGSGHHPGSVSSAGSDALGEWWIEMMSHFPPCDATPWKVSAAAGTPSFVVRPPRRPLLLASFWLLAISISLIA
jgi:hypothetical protein